MIIDFESSITEGNIPYKLPKNWTWYNWNDIMKSYQQGLIRSNSQVGQGNVKYLKMGDISSSGMADLSNLKLTNANEKEIQLFKLSDGDFLINVRNSMSLVGKTCVITSTSDSTILFNHMLVRIDNGSPELNYYVNAYLNIPTSKKLLDRLKEGTTTVIALYQRELKNLPIAIPDEITFRTIVSFYRTILNKIELNNKINAELESMAKLIYDYWFVQFDFPDKNGNPYKSSGGKMVYDDKLNREIPDGWVIEHLEQLIDIYDSERIPLSKSEREKRKGTYPYFGATGILDYVDDFIFDGEYILLAEDGSVMNEEGNPIVQFIWGKTWVNNHAHVIRAKKEELNEYIFQALSRIPVVLIKSGSIQMKINQRNLLSFSIVKPPEHLMLKYSDNVKAFREMMMKNIDENQQLAALRDWLLPMLMNGQVTIKD